jgi:AAA domain
MSTAKIDPTLKFDRTGSDPAGEACLHCGRGDGEIFLFSNQKDSWSGFPLHEACFEAWHREREEYEKWRWSPEQLNRTTQASFAERMRRAPAWLSKRTLERAHFSKDSYAYRQGERKTPPELPPHMKAAEIRRRAWRASHPEKTNGSSGNVIDFHSATQRTNTSPTSAVAKITATPYVWRDPSKIPPRDFLYGNHIVRGYVSATISMGGVGKTSEVQVEVTEMVTGHNLLGGVKSRKPLRVWYINLEDPLEEIERRFAAIFKHYGITEKDIGNRLFIDSGRKTADQPTRSFIVARDGKNGIELDQEVIAEINDTIKANAIDVVVVDPLVNSAHFPENDNNKMAQIIEEVWAAITQRQNCGVELEHHVRKGMSGGRNDGYTVEDARGAGALINSCRSVRVLNTMTEKEGEAAGVERHRSYFRIDNGKANLAPPPEDSEWRKIVSVPLGNATKDGRPEDNVGVVTVWEWPDPMANLTLADLQAAQKAVNTGGPWRADVQAKDWVGKPIAEALRLDLDIESDKTTVKSALKIWIKNKMFKKVQKKDDERHTKTFVEVDQWADDKVDITRMKPASRTPAWRKPKMKRCGCGCMNQLAAVKCEACGAPLEAAQDQEAATSVSVPFMLTQEMKRRLRVCGYSDEQITVMTPQEAHNILDQPAPLATRSAPKIRKLADWYKDEADRRGKENRFNADELEAVLRAKLRAEVPSDQVEAAFEQVMELVWAV